MLSRPTTAAETAAWGAQGTTLRGWTCGGQLPTGALVALFVVWGSQPAHTHLPGTFVLFFFGADQDELA